MRTKAKPESGDVHPGRCANSGLVPRHRLLSLHSLYGFHLERRAQSSKTRSCYSSNKNLLLRPLYAGHRERILACGNYRAGGAFDRSLLFLRLTALVPASRPGAPFKPSFGLSGIKEKAGIKIHPIKNRVILNEAKRSEESREYQFGIGQPSPSALFGYCLRLHPQPCPAIKVRSGFRMPTL